MNYLPSKRGLAICILLLVIVAGWIWFSRNNSKLNIAPDGSVTYERTGIKLAASSSLSSFERDERFFQSFSTSSRTILDQQVGKIKGKIEDELRSRNSLTQLDPKSIAKQHTDDELVQTTVESSSTLKKFGLQVASTLKPLGSQRPNEVLMMLGALDYQDSRLKADLNIKNISDSRRVQENIKNGLLKLKTPRSATPVMVETINTLERMIALLKNMEQVLDKPVPALQSGLLYTKESQNLSRNFNAINLYFRSKGVIFSSNEREKIYLNLQD